MYAGEKVTIAGGPSVRTRVLLIDDDERLNALLTKYLDQFGMAVQAFTRPEPGLRALKSDPPDLLVLDVDAAGDGWVRGVP